MDLSLVLPGLVAVAVVFVVVPVAAATYTYYRQAREVECPVDGRPAIIRVDADVAAIAAVTGIETPCVASCSFWPARLGCGQDCLGRPMRDPVGTRVNAQLA